MVTKSALLLEDLLNDLMPDGVPICCCQVVCDLDALHVARGDDRSLMLPSAGAQGGGTEGLDL